MSKKTTSAHKKALYLAYKTQNRRELNKIKKLQRHLKKHPNDKQSSERREVVSYAKKGNLGGAR